MTDVTIRGIDDEVYAKFTAEAKKREMSIGELTTIVMRALVEDISTTNYRIGNLSSLQVSKKDLESLKGAVLFHNIKTLEFAEDIDWDTFDQRVMSIKNCTKVLIPHTLTRFQVLTKCAMVSEVKVKG
ncbi:MAG: hypothetical protein A4E32_00813 [Methanomassiliicoccales archaeon PtaU1.Bin124]|nr:MAG: hypothetical protein A4E32_00813 [Methanomassiliicoccales archaeon PtaU1.Bin124]